jgi:hypothetical protein
MKATILWLKVQFDFGLREGKEKFQPFLPWNKIRKKWPLALKRKETKDKWKQSIHF